MDKSEAAWKNPVFDKDSVNEEPSHEFNDEQTKKESQKCSNLNEEKRLREMRSVKWNIALMTVSTLLVMAPLNGLSSSTASLLEDENLGITSLSASSITQFLGSAFLVVYMTKLWGPRKMVTATLMLPTLFSLSYSYPSWGTTFPAAVLMGLGTSFISSLYMYGSSLGYYYARLTNGNSDTILVLITAVIYSCNGGAFILGNGITFAVLDTGYEETNATFSSANISYEICGPQYCNEELMNMPTLTKPETYKYYTLVGVFGGMAVLGGILSLFLRDFSVELGSTLRKKSEYFIILKETLGLLSRPRGYLLVILTVFTGLEEAFKASTFTHAYISCTIGIPKVGLIMMAYGGTHTLICLSQGFLVRIFGRLLLVVFGACMVMGCCVALLLWQPQADHIEIFFAIVVVWAAGDAFIVPCVYAMYGILFEDNIEGSFSLGTFWWAVGFMLAFVWSQFLCVKLKLYITLGFGCVGLFFYYSLEAMIRKKNSKSIDIAET